MNMSDLPESVLRLPDPDTTSKNKAVWLRKTCLNSNVGYTDFKIIYCLATHDLNLLSANLTITRWL